MFIYLFIARRCRLCVNKSNTVKFEQSMLFNNEKFCLCGVVILVVMQVLVMIPHTLKNEHNDKNKVRLLCRMYVKMPST